MGKGVSEISQNDFQNEDKPQKEESKASQLYQSTQLFTSENRVHPGLTQQTGLVYQTTMPIDEIKDEAYLELEEFRKAMQQLSRSIQEELPQKGNETVFSRLDSTEGLTIRRMKDGSYYFKEFPHLVCHPLYGCKLRQKLMEECTSAK